MEYGVINLISSGCGSGKTYYCSNALLDDLESHSIDLGNVIYITSRSMIVQQLELITGGILSEWKYRMTDIVNAWNQVGRPEIAALAARGVMTMTYSKLISILNQFNPEDEAVLNQVRVVIIDECHALVADSFIDDINSLRRWIRDHLENKSKLFIGMTATPKILEAKLDGYRFKTKQMLPQSIVNYRANHLIVTQWDALPSLLSSGKLRGRTLAMCHTINECVDLVQVVGNASYIVSTHSRDYRPEFMDQIRTSIAENSVIPEYVEYTDKDTGEFVHVDIDLLAATTTLREGFNLIESSGVRNVISCMPDELHTCQILGRCRHDTDNLIVVKTRYDDRTGVRDKYLHEETMKFNNFFYDHSDRRWYDTISHVVKEDFEDVEFYIPHTALDVVLQKLEPYITQGEFSILVSKDELVPIVDVAKEYNLIRGKDDNKYSVIGLLKYLSNDLKVLKYHTARKNKATHYIIRRADIGDYI